MRMKKLTIAVVICGLINFLGNASYAVPSAQITFGAPTTFTNDSVLISGPLTYAVGLGNSSSVTNVGPQGIPFQADGTNTNVNVLFTPSAGTVASYNAYL